MPLMTQEDSSRSLKQNLPARRKSSEKEQQSLRGNSSTGPKSKKPKPSCNEFRFVNQLGTKDQDEDAKSEVKSHVMRRVWKKHKDSQAKWIKRLPPLRIKEAITPTSDVTSEASSLDSPGPQFRCNIPLSHHRTPRNSFTPSADTTEKSCTEIGTQTDCSSIPIPSGYAHVSPRLAAYIFGSNSDPFGAFPVPLTPRVHQLIHHGEPQSETEGSNRNYYHESSTLDDLFANGTSYLGARNVVRTSVHEDSLDSFSSCVGTNVALMYVTLSWLAAHIGDSTAPENFESSFYLQSSVSAVNNELENADRCGLSEGTIAAVACMTNMENLNGERSRAVIHMNGLEQMVAIRGGLCHLSKVLRRLVLWTDLLYATSWQSTPRFPQADLSTLDPLSSFLPTFVTNPILLLNPCLSHQIIETGNGTLLPILQDAHELSHFLDVIPPKDINYLNEASYPDRVYTIEHHVLILLAQNNIITEESPTRIITPLLHSLLLYTYTNLRLTPVGGKIRRTLVSRLKDNLESTDLTTLNCSFPAEIMWMLFLGGTAAVQGGEDRQWFKEQLWWVLNRNSALEWGWERTGGVLKRVLWLERAFFESCQLFWAESLELEWVVNL